MINTDIGAKGVSTKDWIQAAERSALVEEEEEGKNQGEKAGTLIYTSFRQEDMRPLSRPETVLRNMGDIFPANNIGLTIHHPLVSINSTRGAECWAERSRPPHPIERYGENILPSCVHIA